MKICIPIENDNGLQSLLCSHFGSAPAFLIVDPENGTTRSIPNRNQHHGHGMCMPLAALQGEEIDCLVVGGIGAGALSKLHAAGIEVYLSGHRSVAEAVAAFREGTLEAVQPHMACAHHGHA